MRKLLAAAGVVALGAFAWVGIEAALLISDARRDLAQFAKAGPDLVGQANQKLDRALEEVREARKSIDSQLSGARGDVLTLSGKLDPPLQALTGAIGEISKLRADLLPVRDQAAQLVAGADLTVRDLRPQLLGLVAASKVTAGQTAQTMRQVERATPDAIAAMNEIAANVRRTTEESAVASKKTAEVMTNFAAATKPLPRWARLGITLAPPLIQMGSSIVTTLALTGKATTAAPVQTK